MDPISGLPDWLRGFALSALPVTNAKDGIGVATEMAERVCSGSRLAEVFSLGFAVKETGVQSLLWAYLFSRSPDAYLVCYADGRIVKLFSLSGLLQPSSYGDIRDVSFDTSDHWMHFRNETSPRVSRDPYWLQKEFVFPVDQSLQNIGCRGVILNAHMKRSGDSGVFWEAKRGLEGEMARCFFGGAGLLRASEVMNGMPGASDSLRLLAPVFQFRFTDVSGRVHLFNGTKAGSKLRPSGALVLYGSETNVVVKVVETGYRAYDLLPVRRFLRPTALAESGEGLAGEKTGLPRVLKDNNLTLIGDFSASHKLNVHNMYGRLQWEGGTAAILVKLSLELGESTATGSGSHAVGSVDFGVEGTRSVTDTRKTNKRRTTIVFRDPVIQGKEEESAQLSTDEAVETERCLLVEDVDAKREKVGPLPVDRARSYTNHFGSVIAGFESGYDLVVGGVSDLGVCYFYTTDRMHANTHRFRSSTLNLRRQDMSYLEKRGVKFRADGTIEAVEARLSVQRSRQLLWPFGQLVDCYVDGPTWIDGTVCEDLEAGTASKRIFVPFQADQLVGYSRIDRFLQARPAAAR